MCGSFFSAALRRTILAPSDHERQPWALTVQPRLATASTAPSSTESPMISGGVKSPSFLPAFAVTIPPQPATAGAGSAITAAAASAAQNVDRPGDIGGRG